MRRDVTRRLSDLAGAELTYPEAGATRDGALPSGYGHVFRDVPIGTGRAAFERVADGLFNWNVHRTAGFTVTSTAGGAVPTAVVLLKAGPDFAGLSIPCRVVHMVKQVDCCGFAYGPLPGHPEQGEEALLVSIADDDVRFRIRAFSRPIWLVARWGGRLTRLVQKYATDRYVKAACRIANQDPMA